MGEHGYDKQFDLQAKEPAFWYLKARRLKRASDLLWEAYKSAVAVFKESPDAFFARERDNPTIGIDLDLYETALFLLSLAIENLAKGILIGRDPERSLKDLTHRVADYVQECGIEMSERQKALLKELEAVIRWRGRYPTPKKLEDWRIRQGGSRPGMIDVPGKASLDDIHEKLNTMLLAQDRNATKSAPNTEAP